MDRLIDEIILIGSSTGGNEALRTLFSGMSKESPPCLVAQHIPRSFSKTLAENLDKVSAMTAQEAEDGMIIERGKIYVAPGDRHLILSRNANQQFCCKVTTTGKVNHHRPSVDILFDSAMRYTVEVAIKAVILTGMGKDGSAAMARLRQAGVRTIAQDEATSVVWGMPKAAIDLNAVDQILPIENIAAEIQRFRGNRARVMAQFS